MQTCQSGGVGVSRSEEGGETALEDTYILRCDCKVVSIFSSVGSKYWCRHDMRYIIRNERKSDQAHIPHAPPLHENAVYNKWQFQALVRGNRTENQVHVSCTKYFWPQFKRDINCSLKRLNQHFLLKCISTHDVLNNYKVSRNSCFRGVAMTRKTGMTD